LQDAGDIPDYYRFLVFLQSNHINDVGQLANKVKKINGEYYEVSKEIKKTDRRAVFYFATSFIR
jgi:hypothetical protein